MTEEGPGAETTVGTQQGAVVTPPTILRIAPAGGSVKREWADLVFDSDSVLANLNFSDQRSNNLPPSRPVRIFKSKAWAAVKLYSPCSAK